MNMFLVDYHTHTCCSMDGRFPLEDMVRAAQEAGLKELCTTDHCDLRQQDGTDLPGWDWSPVLEQYERACQTHWDLKLLLGLELGGADTDPAKAASIVAGAPLDLVIGSVHNERGAGGRDFCFLTYESEEMCRKRLDGYFESLLTLAPLPVYDTLAHIPYPMRYMTGFPLPLEPWREQLDAVLRIVIETGHSLEVNTHNGEEIQPRRFILERYRALGGERITLGSDAHAPWNVGKGIPEVRELLLELGFRWLTLYRRRVPTMVALT